MTNTSSLRIIQILVFGVLIPASTCRAQNRPPILEKVAKTYGLDSWDQIQEIRYTWNAQFPGVNISHSWTWQPKTGQVTFEGKDNDGKPVKVTYNRSHLNNEPANVKDTIEPSFVNDNYWVLFPFHAYWDSSADVKDLGTQKLPLGKGSATLVAVKYPAEAGGYTPGDTWDLFVGSDGRVEAFVYHRGGPKKPSVVTATWTDYKKTGPLLIATEHRGTADGAPLRVWFSDVSVKVTGSDAWMNEK